MRRALAAAARFDRRLPADWVVWLLRIGLLVAAVTVWLMPEWDLILKAGTMLLALGGLTGALIIRAIPNHDAVRMRHFEIAWLSIFTLHYLGHAFNLYGDWAWYDKLLHAGGGILAAFCAFWLATSTEWFWPRGKARPFRLFWVCFSVVIVAGVTVELVEYGADTLGGTQSQHHPVVTPLDDTMTDILAETATGFATAGWLAWRLRQAQSAPATTRSLAANRRSSASGSRMQAGGRD